MPHALGTVIAVCSQIDDKCLRTRWQQYAHQPFPAVFLFFSEGVGMSVHICVKFHLFSLPCKASFLPRIKFFSVKIKYCHTHHITCINYYIVTNSYIKLLDLYTGPD